MLAMYVQAVQCTALKQTREVVKLLIHIFSVTFLFYNKCTFLL